MKKRLALPQLPRPSNPKHHAHKSIHSSHIVDHHFENKQESVVERCPLCGLNIGFMDIDKKTLHINSCLDRSDSVTLAKCIEENNVDFENTLITSKNSSTSTDVKTKKKRKGDLLDNIFIDKSEQQQNDLALAMVLSLENDNDTETGHESFKINLDAKALKFKLEIGEIDAKIATLESRKLNIAKELKKISRSKSNSESQVTCRSSEPPLPFGEVLSAVFAPSSATNMLSWSSVALQSKSLTESDKSMLKDSMKRAKARVATEDCSPLWSMSKQGDTFDTLSRTFSLSNAMDLCEERVQDTNHTGKNADMVPRLDRDGSSDRGDTYTRDTHTRDRDTRDRDGGGDGASVAWKTGKGGAQSSGAMPSAHAGSDYVSSFMSQCQAIIDNALLSSPPPQDVRHRHSHSGWTGAGEGESAGAGAGAEVLAGLESVLHAVRNASAQSGHETRSYSMGSVRVACAKAAELCRILQDMDRAMDPTSACDEMSPATSAGGEGGDGYACIMHYSPAVSAYAGKEILNSVGTILDSKLSADTNGPTSPATSVHLPTCVSDLSIPLTSGVVAAGDTKSHLACRCVSLVSPTAVFSLLSPAPASVSSVQYVSRYSSPAHFQSVAFAETCLNEKEGGGEADTCRSGSACAVYTLSRNYGDDQNGTGSFIASTPNADICVPDSKTNALIRIRSLIEKNPFELSSEASRACWPSAMHDKKTRSDSQSSSGEESGLEAEAGDVEGGISDDESDTSEEEECGGGDAEAGEGGASLEEEIGQGRGRQRALKCTGEDITRYIKSKASLFESVLLFRPVDITDLASEMRAHGLRVTKKALRHHFDSNHIFATCSKRHISTAKRKRGGGEK